MWVLHGEPASELGVETFYIKASNDAQVRRKRLTRRIEESPMDGVRIRAADQPQRGDMMRWHHACVSLMELVGPSPARELARDLVDSLGDNQDGPVYCLREKVAEWPVQAAREQDTFSVLSDERERTVDRKHRVGV